MVSKCGDRNKTLSARPPNRLRPSSAQPVDFSVHQPEHISVGLNIKWGFFLLVILGLSGSMLCALVDMTVSSTHGVTTNA